MLFNSFEFVLFLIIVYFLYWYVFSKKLAAQNILILACSYVFYGFWDWRFLFLLLLSTLIDYGFGLLIHHSTNRKKLFLWLSIFNNLIVLGFFKYYNFFAANAQATLALIGFHIEPYILDIVLPVGISFYTFHGMSYVFDIYNEKIVPTKNFIQYAVFVSFFPLLVAGPIERASHLLPQVQKKRDFSYTRAVEGLRLILWGYFLKVVISDTLSVSVTDIFQNYKTTPGSTLLLGAIYFSIQIYGDFCGYTNIALGVAKLFGFELLSNFKYPYFSRNIAEFWRRWHISLSSWFRDYLYIPLGGARVSKPKVVRNTFIIFLVSGFWHGANWTFIVWGGIHALLFVPLLLTNNNRKYATDVVAQHTSLPTVSEFFQMLGTFALVSFAWIFFRAPDVGMAVDYIIHMFTHLFSMPTRRLGIIYVIVPLIIDWHQRHSERSVLCYHNKFVRWGMYLALGTAIIVYSVYNQGSFIYFQF